MSKNKDKVCCILTSILLFTALLLRVPSVEASTIERSLVIVSTTGKVSINQGGYHFINAIANMKLVQGDELVVEKGSVILRTVDKGDEITVGEGTRLFVNTLVKQGNSFITKLHLLTGNAYLNIHDMSVSLDVFELTTPSSQIAVRATHFLTKVDPETGETFVIAAAGAVQASSVQASSTLYPTQQITIDPSGRLTDISIVNVSDLVNQSSLHIIEAIIRSKQSIDEENARFIEQLRKELESTGSKPESHVLVTPNLNDLDKVAHNLDNLVGSIAKEAINKNKLDRDKIQAAIDAANKQIKDPVKKIDLNKVSAIDREAGINEELDEKKKKEMESLLKEKLSKEKLSKEKDEAKKREELVNKNQDVLNKILEEKKKLDEVNRKKAEELRKKAEEDFIQQLSEAERTRFEQDRQRVEEERKKVNGVQPTTAPSKGSGSATSGGIVSPGNGSNSGHDPDLDPDDETDPPISPPSGVLTVDLNQDVYKDRIDVLDPHIFKMNLIAKDIDDNTKVRLRVGFKQDNLIARSNIEVEGGRFELDDNGQYTLCKLNESANSCDIEGTEDYKLGELKSGYPIRFHTSWNEEGSYTATYDLVQIIDNNEVVLASTSMSFKVTAKATIDFIDGFATDPTEMRFKDVIQGIKA